MMEDRHTCPHAPILDSRYADICWSPEHSFHLRTDPDEWLDVALTDDESGLWVASEPDEVNLIHRGQLALLTHAPLLREIDDLDEIDEIDELTDHRWLLNELVLMSAKVRNPDVTDGLIRLARKTPGDSCDYDVRHYSDWVKLNAERQRSRVNVLTLLLLIEHLETGCLGAV